MHIRLSFVVEQRSPRLTPQGSHSQFMFNLRHEKPSCGGGGGGQGGRLVDCGMTRKKPWCW